MTTYTKQALELKVKNLNHNLHNPFLTKSEKNRIEGAIKYYTNKLVEMDEDDTITTITA